MKSALIRVGDDYAFELHKGWELRCGTVKGRDSTRRRFIIEWERQYSSGPRIEQVAVPPSHIIMPWTEYLPILERRQARQAELAAADLAADQLVQVMTDAGFPGNVRTVRATTASPPRIVIDWLTLEEAAFIFAAWEAVGGQPSVGELLPRNP